MAAKVEFYRRPGLPIFGEKRSIVVRGPVGIDEQLVGIDDEVEKESEETEIIGADKTGAEEKFFIIQQRDLSLHFLDRFCDWHKFFFWFRVLIIVNA